MHLNDTDTPPANAFSAVEVQAVYRAIFERRDMRHFSGGSVPPETMRRLLTAAHHAPSVGFMQPWRFVRISDGALRLQLKALVEQERLQTARALGEREDQHQDRARTGPRAGRRDRPQGRQGGKILAQTRRVGGVAMAARRVVPVGGVDRLAGEGGSRLADEGGAAVPARSPGQV